MSLWNPYAYTIQGAPVIGIAPASLRVMGQASAKQLNDARAAFTRFCSMVRLAASHNQREQGLLPDGSRYEIAVVGPATYMTLWPASSGGMPEPYVAWTAYVGTSYLPIWDRPVYAFPSSGPPDPGPAPEYPPPPEEDPYQIAHIQSFVQKEKLPVQANLSMRGGGGATFTVFCLSRAWSYSFPLRGTGQTRCVFGRGIRENYLGFGIETQGQEFTLDRVEIPLVSSARRL